MYLRGSLITFTFFSIGPFQTKIVQGRELHVYQSSSFQTPGKLGKLSSQHMDCEKQLLLKHLVASYSLNSNSLRWTARWYCQLDGKSTQSNCLNWPRMHSCFFLWLSCEQDKFRCLHISLCLGVTLLQAGSTPVYFSCDERIRSLGIPGVVGLFLHSVFTHSFVKHLVTPFPSIKCYGKS